MFKYLILVTSIFLIATFSWKTYDRRHFITLPNGTASVRIGSIFDIFTDHRTVTVMNEYGRVSDNMFAIGDNPRSNIYTTSTDQLVVIGKGGEALFFRVPRNAAPTALNGPKEKLRNRHSETWRYVGTIENGALSHQRECIPLMGEGFSPYRKPFQSNHSC